MRFTAAPTVEAVERGAWPPASESHRLTDDEEEEIRKRESPVKTRCRGGSATLSWCFLTFEDESHIAKDWVLVAYWFALLDIEKAVTGNNSLSILIELSRDPVTKFQCSKYPPEVPRIRSFSSAGEKLIEVTCWLGPESVIYVLQIPESGSHIAALPSVVPQATYLELCWYWLDDEFDSLRDFLPCFFGFFFCLFEARINICIL